MRTRHVYLTSGCIALNLTLAKVAAMLSLPVYMDSVGTILSSALLPWPFVLAVGVLTSLLGGIVISPFFAAYAGTQLAIALVSLLCMRIGLFRTWWKALLSGVIIAVASVIASAPVTVILFGGVTLSGTTAINAVLMAAGNNIWQSVIGGSVFIEAIDKPVAAFIAGQALRRLPSSLK